jgi:hypothetical protein
MTGFAKRASAAETVTPGTGEPVAKQAIEANRTEMPAMGLPEQAERQFADDIIRRLRRMGINFSKSRLSRPYGVGDVC